jgi:hypothetical protein
MARTWEIIFMQIFNNLDKNYITGLGIRQLMSMKLEQLQYLYLCDKNNNSADNNIGS